MNTDLRVIFHAEQ